MSLPRATDHLDVARLDLGQGPDIEDRCLPGERLELEGTQPGPPEAVSLGVAQHDPGDEQEDVVHGAHGEPL